MKIPQPHNIALTNNPQRLTNDQKIWAEGFILHAPVTNQGTVFVGLELADGLLPSTLNETSSQLLYTLSPGDTVEVFAGNPNRVRGDQIQLHQLCARSSSPSDRLIVNLILPL